MHGKEGLVDVFQDHPVEELTAEVQTCCGSGNCALVLSKDGLEVLLVLFGGLLFDKLQDRSLAKGV